MKKLIVSALALLSTFSLAFGQSREGLTEYKLDNGLTVLLWEDHDQPDVTGYVAVRAGSIDEPAEYTGLAHYLEHMLFKGTDRIGALDWEKEKVHYENIIALYDSCAVETDEAKRLDALRPILQLGQALPHRDVGPCDPRLFQMAHPTRSAQQRAALCPQRLYHHLSRQCEEHRQVALCPSRVYQVVKETGLRI